MSRMYNPPHPGEVLREYLPEDMTIADAAERLGVSRQTLSALLNSRYGVATVEGLGYQCGHVVGHAGGLRPLAGAPVPTAQGEAYRRLVECLALATTPTYHT